MNIHIEVEITTIMILSRNRKIETCLNLLNAVIL